MTTEITKQEMIDKIYEVIADKTLDVWCYVFDWKNRFKLFLSWRKPLLRLCWENPYQKRIVCNEELEDVLIEKIIWHPCMIGDVLDWYYKNVDNWLLTKFARIVETRKAWDTIKLRKPIEDQSEECIRFIYNLCK